MFKICKHCIKNGRYSKFNLQIDLRDVMWAMEQNNLMAGDFVSLAYQKEEIIKRLLDRSLMCNCN